MGFVLGLVGGVAIGTYASEHIKQFIAWVISKIKRK